ncbi:MAG: DNA gyrase inhibitor YacG [Burkholderiales bacterium]|nr:DNA gyrase inhibitor YacG [Burkholderiales bacterium]
MQPGELKERIVRCPGCGGDTLYSLRNPYRPFCSARCKGIDFGDWASESFRVPDDTSPDDFANGKE